MLAEKCVYLCIHVIPAREQKHERLDPGFRGRELTTGAQCDVLVDAVSILRVFTESDLWQCARGRRWIWGWDGQRGGGESAHDRCELGEVHFFLEEWGGGVVVL